MSDIRPYISMRRECQKDKNKKVIDLDKYNFSNIILIN